MMDDPTSIEIIQRHLEEALDASPEDKDYHIREALQACVVLDEAIEERTD